MRSERNQRSDAQCALARYPRTPILLAIEFLRSDRRAAGLGALGERSKRPLRRVMRYKEFDPERSTIIYVFETFERARQEFVRQPLALSPSFMDAVTATVQTRVVPERHLRMVVEIDPLNSHDRAYVAHVLRDRRRHWARETFPLGMAESASLSA